MKIEIEMGGGSKWLYDHLLVLWYSSEAKPPAVLYLLVKFPYQHTTTPNGYLVSGPSDFQITSSRLVMYKH